MKIYFYFYKITNKLNNKFYYGVHKTENLEDGYMGSGKRLNYAKLKYGIENFEREILEFFDTYEELLDFEAEVVTEQLVLDENCYNLRIGGQGGFSKEESLKGTKMMLEKIWSDPEFIKRKRKRSSEVLKRLHREGKGYVHSWNGLKHREESKEKLKKSLAEISHQQGEKNSQFGTKWITNGKVNRKIEKNEQIPEGWKRGRKMK